MVKPTEVNFINETDHVIKIKPAEPGLRKYKNVKELILGPGMEGRIRDYVTGGMATPDVWVDVIVAPEGPGNNYKLDEWKFDNPGVGDPAAQSQKAVFLGSVGLHKRASDAVNPWSDDPDAISRGTSSLFAGLSLGFPGADIVDLYIPQFMHRFRRITKAHFSAKRLLSLGRFTDDEMRRQNKASWVSYKNGKQYLEENSILEGQKDLTAGYRPYQFPVPPTVFETEAFTHDNGAKFWDLHIKSINAL